MHFHVDFEFRSKLLQLAIGAVFHETVRRMVAAFLTRARAVYGPPLVSAAVMMTRTASEGSASS